jgi:hypothetical protein
MGDYSKFSHCKREQEERISMADGYRSKAQEAETDNDTTKSAPFPIGRRLSNRQRRMARPFKENRTQSAEGLKDKRPKTQKTYEEHWSVPMDSSP